MAEIEELYVDVFDRRLESAYKLYNLELESAKRVVILGYAEK